MFLRMSQGMALLPQVQTWTFRRAGSMNPNPTTFAQRSAAFASAATGRYNSVALISTRTEEGVQGYLVSGPWNGINNAALNLAHAVGAKVERVPTPPQLLGPGRGIVGRLEYEICNSGGLIKAGAAPTEVITTLAQSMPMNSRIGATIRRPFPGSKTSCDLSTELHSPSQNGLWRGRWVAVGDDQVGAGQVLDGRALDIGDYIAPVTESRSRH